MHKWLKAVKISIKPKGDSLLSLFAYGFVLMNFFIDLRVFIENGTILRVKNFSSWICYSSAFFIIYG